jgi:DNA repair exonuclease SbcCD ATPase subunit
MHIQRIKLRNWRNIAALDLSLSPGINLIYGPNETGKSTIIEAIRMGLAGNAGGGGKEYRELIPWGSKVKAAVELDIQAADRTLYRICKSFPKGDARVTLPAKNDFQLASGAGDTQTRLNQILGIENELHTLWNLLFVKQGEVLDIIDPDRKKNPLDKGLKLHIEQILRETAQKELDQFQQVLEQRLSAIFTPTGKLTSKSDYYKLLMEERECGEKLDELQELEREYLKKVEELETCALDRKQLEQAIHDHSEMARQLELKKETAAALEKEELKYTPLRDRYERVVAIDAHIETLEQELPLLLGRRIQCLALLDEATGTAKKNQAAAQQRLEQLKVKKAMSSAHATNRQALEKVEGLYNEIKEIEGEIEKSQSTLPRLLAAARDILKPELAAIENRFKTYDQLKREIEALERRMAEEPPVTEEDIDGIRGKTAALTKQKAALEAAESRMELRVNIEPLGAPPADLFIRKDKGHRETVSTSNSTAISDFNQLEIEDPGRYKLEFSGSLKGVNLPELQTSVATLERELKTAFEPFDARDLKELETIYQSSIQRNQQLEGLRRQLKGIEPDNGLNLRKSTVEAQLKRIESLQQTYPLTLFNAAEELGRDKDPVQEALLVSDRLSQLERQLEDILEGTSFQQTELAYRRLKDDCDASERRLMVLEPRDVPQVEEHHIEKQIEAKNEIQREIDRLQDHKSTLEEMELPPDLIPSSPETGQPEPPTPFEHRRAIEHSMQELQTQKAEKERLLDQDTPETLRREFLAADDSIGGFKQKLQHMPPRDITSTEEITGRRHRVLETIEDVNRQLREVEHKHHRLLGEIGGFSANARQKDLEEDRHRKLLRQIRTRLADIAATRLLLELLRRQKERMQERIFAPIQERVSSGFHHIVGDRYQVTVNEDLTLDIKARVDGERFQPDIRDAVSFGTREQLSFMFRLAIAGQLSKQEPQVMILDDSFVNTDQERLGQIIDIIRSQQENLQFLIFTCRDSDYTLYRDTFHCVDLSTALDSASTV